MLKVQIPIPKVVPVDLPALVLAAFAAEAGPVAVQGVHGILGTSAMDLTLSEPYSERKITGKIKDLKRYAGKEVDQPGILTGSLYEGVDHQVEPGIGFSVGIQDGAGEANGEDYAEDLEERTQYLDKGVESVEMEMLQILETVIGRVIKEAGG